MAQPQNFKNHTRWHPVFHFFLMPVLVANIVVTCVWYAHHHYQHYRSGPWAILMSIMLVVIAGTMRNYSLKVQDRVIRLEERIRLASLCSASEMAELDSLTMKQYTALRFASNTELPELARRAVRENLDGKAIKQAVMAWRPDYDRV